MGAGEKRVAELFDAALDLEPDAIEAFLATECGDDPAVAEKVRVLLDLDREPDPRSPIGTTAQGNVFGFSAPPIEEIHAPSHIGRLAVLEQIGEGGMGKVYAAYDDKLDRRVAVKLLSFDFEDGRKRFVREAQAMARVVHPNVAAIHDVGEVDGNVYLSMEYLRGGTLTQWQAVPRSWREVLDVYAGAGRGLAAAHAVGLVHRDFKPDNVLLDDEGRPRVVDFGLARAHGEDEPEPSVDSMSPDSALRLSVTQAGVMLGTPRYMSPEQFTGASSVNPRSDQFCFCVALYEALYGVPPFDGDTLFALRDAIVSGDVRPPPDDRGVPACVTAAVLRGLSTEPEERHPSMGELLDALESHLAHDHEADLAVSARARRVALALLILVFFGTVVTIPAGGIPDAAHAFWLAVATTVSVVVIGVALRGPLLRTRANRHITYSVLAVVVLLLVHRGLGVVLGTPIADLLVADHVLIAGVTVVGAITIERALAIVSAIAMIGAVAAALVPPWATHVMGVTLFSCLALPVYFWGRLPPDAAAPKTPAADHAEGLATTARG